MKGMKYAVYGAAAATVFGSALVALGLETGFRREMKRELKHIRKLQDMEHDFRMRQYRMMEEELDEIRDEICTVYGHLEEMETIRECGR